MIVVSARGLTGAGPMAVLAMAVGIDCYYHPAGQACRVLPLYSIQVSKLCKAVVAPY